MANTENIPPRRKQREDAVLAQLNRMVGAAPTPTPKRRASAMNVSSKNEHTNPPRLLDSVVLVEALREEIQTLQQQIRDLENERSRDAGELDDMRGKLAEQDVLAAEFTDIVAQIDDLFQIKFLPTPLRLSLSEFARSLGACSTVAFG